MPVGFIGGLVLTIVFKLKWIGFCHLYYQNYNFKLSVALLALLFVSLCQYYPPTIPQKQSCLLTCI